MISIVRVNNSSFIQSSMSKFIYWGIFLNVFKKRSFTIQNLAVLAFQQVRFLQPSYEFILKHRQYWSSYKSSLISFPMRLSKTQTVLTFLQVRFVSLPISLPKPSSFGLLTIKFRQFSFESTQNLGGLSLPTSQVSLVLLRTSKILNFKDYKGFSSATE